MKTLNRNPDPAIDARGMDRVRRPDQWGCPASLTHARHDEILAEQGGGGGLCRRATATWKGGVSFAVDHDHRCCPDRGRSCGKCIRGLPCGTCNGMTGFYELCLLGSMRVEQITRYNRYLRRHKIPGRAGVPGRPGKEIRDGWVRVEYHPARIRDRAPLIYASIAQRRAAGLAAVPDEEFVARISNGILGRRLRRTVSTI
jgi:hypothetical protein